MQIIVKTPSGKYIALEVEPTDTIRDVKSKIQDKIGMPTDQSTLAFAGKILDADRTIAEYNMRKDSVVNPMLKLQGGTTIKVNTLTGKETEIGKQLADEKTAKDYNIETNSVVHLVLALRGGRC